METYAGLQIHGAKGVLDQGLYSENMMRLWVCYMDFGTCVRCIGMDVSIEI